MAFVAAVIGFSAVLAVLLWFTGWAEQEVIVEAEPLKAKTR
jgi:hypothetical protein